MNKKGFTLLEVMLAVAIMAIASTMIMVGFLTTMNYSRNSALYARVGSANYNNCLTQLNTMTTNETRRNQLNPGLNSLSNTDITINGTNISTTQFIIHWTGTSQSGVRALKITDDMNNTVTAAGGAYNVSSVSIPNGSGETVAEATQTGGAHEHSYTGTSTYSDNRTTFFYYQPVICPICQTAGRVGTVKYGSAGPSGADTAGGEGYWCTYVHTDDELSNAGYPVRADGIARVAHYDGGSIVSN